MSVTLNTLIPNRQKALFLAKKQLPVLVCDAVNLEGVNFTLPEVQTLLDGVTVGGHSLQDEIITLNQANAWRFLFDRVEANQFSLEHNFVCELHEILAQKESLSWGIFRDGKVTIAGTDYAPPDADKLSTCWSALIEKHQSVLHQEKIDIEKTYTHAISVFLEMARMQFFYDANKRLGRIMMNGILLTNGLPAINLPAKKQLEFNQQMLDFYPSNDEKLMQNFMRECLDTKILTIMSESTIGRE